MTAVIDGFPAGLPVDVERVNQELGRRQQGYGRGARQKIETDEVVIVGGVRHGITTGAPLGLQVRNRDWDNWKHVMSLGPIEKTEEALEQMRKKAIETVRPGHADLAGAFKFAQSDIRDVLERASARETAARVAVGALCLQLLEFLNVRVLGHVVQVGEIKAAVVEEKTSLAELEAEVLASDMFCADRQAAENMKSLIKTAWQQGDSLGGVVEVLADGLPIGLGSYTQWDRKLDGLLSQAIVSIQAFKAAEIGDGMAASGKLGSQVHDAIYPSQEGPYPFKRLTNCAGGIEGGMTNGSRLVVRGYMKPLPTMRKGLESVSFPGFGADTAHYERSDVCAIAAASVVAKAMVCFVLANAFIDKFGGDNAKDLKSSLDAYRQQCSTAKYTRSRAATLKGFDRSAVNEDPDSLGEF